MGLLSFFKRRADAPSGVSAVGDSVDPVQRARTRARQRLIGAVVLVAIGVIGFPLVFETQPRPIPVDIPIELPKKDGAPPLAMPAARGGGVASNRAAPVAAGTRATAPKGGAVDDVITETSADAGRDVAATRAAVASAARAAATSAPRTPAASAMRPSDAAVAARPQPASRPVAAEPARPVAKAEPSRFVVQIGAFADATAAREARAKVEKLGLKTYTQVAGTAGGNRIRVRVGPFDNRNEADMALAKTRAAGVTGVVLTL